MILSEQYQLRKIRKGDIQAYEQLFYRFFDGMFRYASSIVKTGEVAEEIVQDVFYNLWKNRESLRIHSSWKSYLYRAVYNNSLMYLRKHRMESISQETGGSGLESGLPGPDQQLQLEEMTQVVSATLDNLPERTRQIFNMNRNEGMKYTEIAKELSISVKTVEAHMGKGLKALRSSIKKYREE